MEEIKMNKFWMALAASLFVVACDGGKDSNPEADADTDADADFDADVTWGAGSVDLTQTGGVAGYFGLAETGCGDPENCWYGEDCIYGDHTGNYYYCHTTNDSGVSLAYGGAFDAISEGADTVFTDSSFDGTVTYYVEQGDACYVWGNDVSYYAGLGCTEW
jgi:hypothetical protein